MHCFGKNPGFSGLNLPGDYAILLPYFIAQVIAYNIVYKQLGFYELNGKIEFARSKRWGN